jgi:hypothetical protein
MMMAQRDHRALGVASRVGVGLLLAGGVALMMLVLERWHAARYGLALTNLTPWLPSLLAFALGVALVGASLGGWWYRQRRCVGEAARSRLDAALLIVGALLLLFNAPAALDLTVTAPATTTGPVTELGQSVWPFEQLNQYDIGIDGRQFVLAHDTYRDAYRSEGSQCITVVYGPRSQIAFAVTLVPFSERSAERLTCGEPTGAAGG